MSSGIPSRVAALLVGALVFGGCGDGCGNKDKPTLPDAAIPPANKKPEQARGLSYRLTTGGELGAPTDDRVRTVAGTKLSATAAAALLRRMKELPASEKRTFAFRGRSLPPPTTGEKIKTVFPPPQRPPAPATKDAGPLKVLRFSPEGDIELAPHLSVTFSQPMVAVTSHDEAAKKVPVKLSPQPEGKWRWVGTRTLLFEPSVRFAMATRYQVEVPAGTVSARGGKLAAAKKWSFSTPPLRLRVKHPTGSPHPLRPIVFLGFDQQIDPQAVKRSVRVRGDGRDAAMTLLDEAALAKLDDDLVAGVRPLVAGAGKQKRWLALRPSKALQAGTDYEVTLVKGAPSAEGPRETEKEQSFKFTTYHPLKVKDQNCTATSNCRPLTPMWIRFNNPLDAESFVPASVKVKPEVPEQSVDVNGRYLYIRGNTKGRTTYRVVLPAELTDTFGQRLGSSEVVSFRFGDALPQLLDQRPHFRVLDPSGPKTFSFRSINHSEVDLELYRVRPEHWSAFKKFLQKGIRDRPPGRPPGQLKVSRRLRIKGSADELVKTSVDLGPALVGGYGQVIVLIKQRPFPVKPWRRQFIAAWLQATDLAVDAFVDHGHLLAWATRLEDGRPASGAKVRIVGTNHDTNVQSDGQGLARLVLPPQPVPNTTRDAVLVVESGKDLAMVPESAHPWGGGSGWYKQAPPGEVLRWYVFDDRKLYRPKEEVRVKGWIRLVDMGATSNVRLAGGVKRISYRVVGPRNNNVGKGSVAVGALGGFDLRFKLPDRINLGHARVELTAEGGAVSSGQSHRHGFQIQEFKRPEFEVSSRVLGGPHLVGGAAEAEVSASYFSGGGLAGAEVRYYVAATPGSFRPPGAEYSAYTFVGWRPSWWSYNEPTPPNQSQRFTGRTDGKGRDRLRLIFDAMDPPRPAAVSVNATVVDVNRQSWSTSSNLVVHPSSAYVGLKTERYFVEQGKPMKVEAVVADLNGKRLSGRPIKMRFARITTRYERGRWYQVEVDEQLCETKSAADKPSECSFRTHKGGTHLISATVIDAKARPNHTEMTRWVTGGKPQQKGRKQLGRQSAQLIADKKQYSAGETAEILVQAPFADAEGLMTIRRAGIRQQRRFRIKGTSTTLKVPITEDHMPSLAVQVELVGKASRTSADGKPLKGAPHRPAFAGGTVSLPVPPLSRKLTLQVSPAPKRLAPGGSTRISVLLTDVAGRPVVGGEVAVVVVDEAVLALTGYKLADPLALFYPYRGAGVRDHYMRAAVRLATTTELSTIRKGRPEPEPSSHAPTGSSRRSKGRSDGRLGAIAKAPPAPPAKMAEAKQKRGGIGGKDQGKGSGSQPAPIAVRSDFRALALFAPSLRTDEKGEASVSFKVPDTLTRYRVVAVGVGEARYYGQGESTITAQLPLAIRPAAPRFLSFGDKVQLPIVLHNRTNQPLPVEVALRATTVTLADGDAVGRKLTIPPDDRLEVRFEAEARAVGTAHFQVAASAGSFADGTEFSLPVWTPATTEAFATYGVLDKAEPAVQPVRMPPNVVKEFGGLQISTSSTALSALTDAVLYLLSYRFECAEQVSSRVLAIAALRDVLAAFKAPGLPPPDKRIIAAVARDMKKLQGLQGYGGGFGLWRRDEHTWPFVTLHVTHALVRAKARGFVVPAQMLQRALNYARSIESHIPGTYSEATRRAIISYSLYVRALAGDVDVRKAKQTYAELRRAFKDKLLPLEGIAWLYPVLSGQATATAEISAIRQLLKNRVAETAATAQFNTSYGDNGYLLMYSSRRLDALLLEGLIKDQPRSDLVVKLVRGLLGHRKRGRWGNTQENAWVLLALDRYFRKYEGVTPRFVARAWLGERFAGQHAFRGRTTEQHQISVPMNLLAALPGGQADLTIAKQGPGRLYYRIGMRYAPADLRLPPSSHGFTVRRTYEAVDDKQDVRRDSDGTWRFKAGKRVRVKLTLVAPARRYHVALVDPLPAGLEPVNAELRGTQRDPGAANASRPGKRRSYRHRGHRGRGMRWYRWWRPRWYEHQNLRDERAEAFTSLLYSGVHTFSYTARATTPGTFVVAPAKAEEMYHPETFGRGAGARVIVED